MLSIADLKKSVIGLGYVGLPLAVEFGKKVPVVGFDIYQKRIDELKSGQHHTLYDAIILAVVHDQFKKMTATEIHALGKGKYVLFDLKYVVDQSESSLRS
ncbi:hypothetical protein [Acinetobacter sp. YH12102]|uniref:hypothetical protein n=1 Tax=Acinetobacter sp. YH12102 TaxID=2601091 RepID=UPI00211E00F1|nr:hypothetical protein [Acinetobacter sp. YH12102]